MTASSSVSPPLLQSYPRSHAGGHHERVSARRSVARSAPACDQSPPARLRAPHSHEHLLHRARCERKLLRVAGAQHYVGIGPVLRIEEWVAADRDFGIGLGDLAELGPDIALARVRAHGLRQNANTGFELGGDL